jgi:glycosidase
MFATPQSSVPNNRRIVAWFAIAGIVLSLLAAVASPAEADPPGELAEGDVIYMVLTDRFYDGDATNNDLSEDNYDPDDLAMYHGGDWAGLTEKIDYISELGATAIWISPVSEQEPLSRDEQEASYHGYFTHDFAEPNPHFGDLDDLQDLIDEAHTYGIKMILDVVPNHTADYFLGTSSTYSPSTYRPASPLDDADYFHHDGDCLFDGSMNQAQLETCDLGGLDDLDQSESFVSDFLIDTYQDWIAMGFDGIRVDAARSIPKTWLETFEDEMGVPTFGEIFHGDIGYVSEYQDYEWGVLDFPFFFTVRGVFAGDGDMRDLGALFDQDYQYNNANRLQTFIDNHDRARFLTWANDDYQRLRSALSFMMSARGIPVIYYGTEQADDGNGNASEVPIANKDNRKSMESFDEEHTIFVHIHRLNELKANYSPLRIGTQREMWEDEEVYAFSRRNDSNGEETITISNGRFTEETRTIPLRSESSISVSTVLTNLLDTSETVTVTSGGVTGKQITVTVGEHETAIYAPGTPVSSYTPPERNLTVIRVHYDVGWGNNIAIRGDSYPLDWDYGRAARNVASDIWEFSMERIPEDETFEFKPLINDSTWSTGNNYTGTGGDVIDIYPNF